MLAARNFSEWYAFFGGEEMCVSRDDAARIWEAATKAAEARFTSTNKASAPGCKRCGGRVTHGGYCASCHESYYP